jgi:hypothetical protein
MSYLFPFFYYDVLARIIPGAFTLAVFRVLEFIPGNFVYSWMNIFAGDKTWKSVAVPLVDIFTGSESWKSVVVPLLLGGLSYMIGVIYEALEFLPRNTLDKIAFKAAWKRFRDKTTNMSSTELACLEKVRTNERWRIHLWEKLVYYAARKSNMVSVFWHCHRFQGEYKMFCHLIYPTLILLVGSYCKGNHPAEMGAVVLIVLFVCGAYFRDARRWWQLLSFAEQLSWFWEYCS